MQDSAPRLSLHQCREVTRVRCEQMQQLVASSVSKDEIASQVSDALTQTVLALAEYIGDDRINKNVEALIKAYDQLELRLGIRPYITEVEDTDEGELEYPVDEV